MSVVLSGIVLSSITTSATDTTSYEDQVSITVPASCTMGGVGSNTHNATLNPGTWSGASGSDYENGIGKTTLTVFCNDYNGFSIYAVGYTGNTAGNTNLVGASTSTNIATGTSTSGATSNWSMKVNKETDTSIAYTPANMNVPVAYTSWHEVPSTYTQVAEYKASTGSSATDDVKGAKVNTTYAAFISSTQVADTYEGQVKYTMVHPYNNDTNSYIVEFLANGGTGTMTPQKITRGTATALTTNAFTAPTGLSFKEWNTKADGTGTSYADGASVTNIGEAGGTATLFAIWAPKYYMQDMDSTTIAALLPNVGDTVTMYDKRDTVENENEYTIAKLADNKYWMTTNLNLAGGTALSADDTNVTSAYISSFSTSNNLTKSGSTIVLPASSTSGFDTANYSYVYNSGNKTNCGASGQDTPCYSYYSWDAATLGSGRSISTDNTDAQQSICPKGWKLPTSRTTSATNWQTTSDFYVLAHQYGLDSTTSTSESDNGFYTQAGPGTVPNFLLAGHYLNGLFYYGGGGGYYWSSTSASSTSSARYLLFSSSYVYSADNSLSRNSGFSVRCLLSGQ